MVWQNDSIILLYHGTDLNSANSIRLTGVDLTRCRSLADFGKGFYTTTNLLQAKNWAKLRCKRLILGAVSVPSMPSVVLRFELKRNELAKLQTLYFVTEGLNPPNTDYWDLVTHCRQGPYNTHNAASPTRFYDVVCGPVAVPHQTLVLKDCDQISFHTSAGVNILPTPHVQNV